MTENNHSIKKIQRLEAKLLSLKKCEFTKEGCTKKAEMYLAKKLVDGMVYQKNPICKNCFDYCWTAVNDYWEKQNRAEPNGKTEGIEVQSDLIYEVKK